MGPTVILIGAARSGTKLLRSLIARHPGISAVPYDINYVWRFGNEAVPHDELSCNMLTEEKRRRILSCIEKYRAPAGGVVEKTVSNTLRVSYVNAVVPDALYVHLIRDGRDAIASSYEQWRSAPDWQYVLRKAAQFPLLKAPRYALEYGRGLLRRRASGAATGPVWGPRYRGIDEDLGALPLVVVCALQWVNSVRQACAASSVLSTSRALTIRYENLVRNPCGALLRVAKHIGVDPAPYVRNYSDTVNPSRVATYRTRLGSEEVLMIERTARDELERLGYGSPVSGNSCAW